MVEECTHWFSATAFTLHLVCTLREWPFSYCAIKATMFCVIPQEIPKEKAICSGAWHKWLTAVEHSIGNYPLYRRQKIIPPTTWHRGTPEGPPEISTNKGQTRLHTISLRKSHYSHCTLRSRSRSEKWLQLIPVGPPSCPGMAGRLPQ